MAERQPPTPGSVDRANSASAAVGETAGEAETTAAVVKTRKNTVACPNCKRIFDVGTGMHGKTIPCLCGFLINVD